MTSQEMKTWIDCASYETLLQKWRFAETGNLFFQGDVGNYYSKVIRDKRSKVGSDAAVSASKSVGWGFPDPQ